MTEKERDRLDVLEAKVDRIIGILEDPDFGVRAMQKDHEGRIRSVERWKLSVPISGLLAVATFMGAVVARLAHWPA